MSLNANRISVPVSSISFPCVFSGISGSHIFILFFSFVLLLPENHSVMQHLSYLHPLLP